MKPIEKDKPQSETTRPVPTLTLRTCNALAHNTYRAYAVRTS
jgi:hypothetical protein